MNILKTILILMVAVPAFVLAQTGAGIPAAQVRSTADGGTSTNTAGIKEDDPKTTGIEHEDIGATGKDEGDEDDDNDGKDETEDFSVDSFFDVTTELRLDDDDDGDGFVDELDDDGAQVDSFFDVFVDYSDEETRAIVDAFFKIKGIEGESIDGETDKEASEVTSGDGEPGTSAAGRSSKPKEIVVVGSKVREEVQTSGVVVRGWDPEKKEVTIEPEDIEKGEDFLDFIGAVVLSDENIENVSLNFQKIKMDYDQPAKLFGFIPMTLTAEVELEEDGSVKVKFPWFAFLTRDNVKEVRADIENVTESAQWNETDLEFLQQRARRFQTISNVLKAAHDIASASIRNFK